MAFAIRYLGRVRQLCALSLVYRHQQAGFRLRISNILHNQCYATILFYLSKIQGIMSSFVLIFFESLQSSCSHCELYYRPLLFDLFLVSFKVLQPFSQKIVSIVLTFSLKIIVRQFLNPFQKDYLTTNFNLTTTITLTIKILLWCTRYNIM